MYVKDQKLTKGINKGFCDIRAILKPKADKGDAWI